MTAELFLTWSPITTHKTTHFGDFSIAAVRNDTTLAVHLVLFKGQLQTPATPVRIMSACTTGIVLDGATCDCREQLGYCLEYIATKGLGVLIHLDQEGRSHGLFTKIEALKYKNEGLDTYAAVESLGLAADQREYRDAVEILSTLGIRSIELLSANPDKIKALKSSSIEVVKITPTPLFETTNTRAYYAAKRRRGFLI